MHTAYDTNMALFSADGTNAVIAINDDAVDTDAAQCGTCSASAGNYGRGIGHEAAALYCPDGYIPAGRYFLVVGGFQTSAGRFTLTMTIGPGSGAENLQDGAAQFAPELAQCTPANFLTIVDAVGQMCCDNPGDQCVGGFPMKCSKR
eukprot:SAG22_NODE_2132_length_2962_cov_1.578414_4_plen_147_part_00